MRAGLTYPLHCAKWGTRNRIWTSTTANLPQYHGLPQHSAAADSLPVHTFTAAPAFGAWEQTHLAGDSEILAQLAAHFGQVREGHRHGDLGRAGDLAAVQRRQPLLDLRMGRIGLPVAANEELAAGGRVARKATRNVGQHLVDFAESCRGLFKLKCIAEKGVKMVRLIKKNSADERTTSALRHLDILNSRRSIST